MNPKHPIDFLRESGLSTNIGTYEDGGITGICSIKEKLIIIKERSIYDLVYADNLDPLRLDPKLPPSVQRLILSYGSDSEMISRTFLTAMELLDDRYIKDFIKVNYALMHSFDATIEICAMHDQIEEYKKLEIKSSNEYLDRMGKDVPFILPSIRDVKTRCKTIIQKADHTFNFLLEIIRLFYPDFGQQYYSNFYDFVAKKYGETDPFSEFIENWLSFFLLVRNIRNCLEHNRKELIITDYEINTNIGVLSPTLAIDYNHSKLERSSLISLLPVILENVIIIFEELVAHLCARYVFENNKLLPHHIDIIELGKRHNKHIRFGYVVS